MATKKLYELTPEHRAELEPWAEAWIDNALNCEPMDAADRAATIVAIDGMYEAAGLEAPLNIVFVPSPLVLAFAGCFAAGIWYLRDHEAATEDATWAATRAATRDATRAATWAATQAATQAATWAATGAIVRFLLSCCSGWSRMWNGGNQWSGYVAYLGFFCHVAKLDLPVYEKWQHYEAAAIHGGPRVVHPKFCMVSDRPLFIHRDEENRPHCETGPFCQWRDGWALYYIHGVRVTRQIVEFPETLTVERIREEENAEVRRVMIDRFTPERYLLESDAALIHEEHEPAFPGLMHAQLWQTERPGDAPLVMVKCRNSTPEAERGGDGELVYKTYWLRVDHEIRPLLADDGYGRPQKATCLNALASTWGLRGEEYMPLVES